MLEFDFATIDRKTLADAIEFKTLTHLPWSINTIIFFILSFAISILSYNLIDKKGLDWRNRLLAKRKTT